MTENELTDFIERWLSTLADSTRASYSRTVSGFINYCGSVEKVLNCDKIKVEAYLDELGPLSGKDRRGRPSVEISSRTKLQKLACLRTLFTQLLIAGIIENNPAEKIKIVCSERPVASESCRRAMPVLHHYDRP